MSVVVSDTEINRAKEMIYELAGIYLSNDKDLAIKNRLNRLIKSCNIQNFDIFFSQLKNGKFKQEFINTFTNNKTDFFREDFHFVDMLDRILPHRLKKTEPLKVWCSAASMGEEPYSIAATLSYAKDIYGSNTPCSILATDIDTSVLETAKTGEYVVDTCITPLPEWLDLENSFEIIPKSERDVSIKIKSTLKNLITFKQLNLQLSTYPFGYNEFDIIFCRNQIIYFKIEDQEKVLKKIFSYLKVGGTLYLGHSESPLGIQNKVEKLGQNIFIKVMD
ncbi:CheR family methyltransferase [Helicobacter mesocricetorum]|uniref:CheR family methyltransferase n=1 Tax=Helicobacter mesocricetorum TaxID=87012 RepID=UPI000CF12583|nr:protein-glutamate O-methyltransferase CheR [Helicobacter mesocricetorum]